MFVLLKLVPRVRSLRLDRMLVTWLGRKNGLRTDVAQWLNESQPAFLRTPGGCYVEGHNLSASGWDWKQTLGPIQTRPGHMNDVWGYWTDVRDIICLSQEATNSLFALRCNR